MPLRALRRTVLAAALACAAPAAAELPFCPNAINTVTGLPASLDEFTPADRCAYCHPLQKEEWTGSMQDAADRHLGRPAYVVPVVNMAAGEAVLPLRRRWKFLRP